MVASLRLILTLLLLRKNRTKQTIRNQIIPIKTLLLVANRAFKGAPINVIEARSADGKEEAFAARKREPVLVRGAHQGHICVKWLLTLGQTSPLLIMG